MGGRKLSQFSPSRTILISVFITIIIGTFFLWLPCARTEAGKSASILDLFFTATSVTCVTGLFPLNIQECFTTFGHTVLMLLMQVGALGLITMTLFFMALFTRLGLTTQLMAGQVLEIDKLRKMRTLVLSIVTIAFATEAIGAIFMFIGIRNYYSYPLSTTIFRSIFQAVASFCNAPGVTLLDNGIIPPNSAVLLIASTCLVFFGGMGFIVWREILDYIASLFKKRRHMFTLHSKIVLFVSSAIVLSAGAMFFILERNVTMVNLSWPYKIINSIFHAVTSRSSGVLSCNLNDFVPATIFIIMIISFIGSAPGSPGSGIKVTNLAIFFSAVKSTIYGRSHVSIMGRRIAMDQIYKSIAIIFLSIIWILIATLLLMITEGSKSWGLQDILFENISAFANLGLTTGITTYLSSLGKIIIIIGMIVGRIGGLTFLLALKRVHKEKRELAYPEERIMLS
ncbi:TrkH family potassium uptake protein [Candidatus Dependentiae bacterium]